ncbi:hypothetical protein PORY_002034 [Pneumocystis oryctolagi]|uniref:Uncharacterized protein n=1 Tax=Pneumocystis oryctolagi TaxID=42067 RepID=A0ACB7CAM2_9ASCO|nr:hypothetical protein PORY_002034 [Pneumocystis oryctolagi]
MATRNRTRLFIAYRQSCVHHPQRQEERWSLLGAVELAELSGLQPDWCGTREAVERLLLEIGEDREALERLYKKNLLPGFDDRRRDQDDMEQRFMRMTERLRKCQNLIKAVIPRHGATLTEIKMAKNVQIALANKIQTENAIFRKKQSINDLLLVELHKVHQNTYTSDFNTSVVNQDSSLESQDTNDSEKILQSPQRILNEAEIIYREKGIMDITKRMLELSDIFKEIQSIITSQGSILDCITTNIDDTAMHINNANKALTQCVYVTEYCKKLKELLDFDSYLNNSIDVKRCRHIHHLFNISKI